jgi:hypothetical protein
MMMGYDSLENFFKTNFALMTHHKYDLGYLDGVLPWERAIYINFLEQYLREEEKKRKDMEKLKK